MQDTPAKYPTNVPPNPSSAHNDGDIFSILVNEVKDYAIFIVDASGFVTTWNHGAENIKGYTAKEIVGKHISIFYTPEDIAKEIPQHNLHEALHNGRYEDEGWRLRKDGTLFWANIIFTALHNKDGTLKGYAKITRDITARKQNEEKLAALATLIENTSDAVFSTTPSLQILTWNKAAEKLYGYTVDEVLGKTTLETIKPQISEELLAKRGEIIEKQSHWSGEITQFTKNGKQVIVAASISGIRNNQGNITAYVFVARDKTEEIKNQETIAYLANLVDKTSDAIFSYNINEEILSWNKAAEIVYGYKANEVIGKQITDIVRGQLDEHQRNEIRKHVKAKGSWSGEVIHLRKDDARLYMQASVTVVLNTKKEIAENICICRDVTARKIAEQTERLLKEQVDRLLQNKLDATLKDLSDYKYALDKSSIIAITNQKGRIQYVNENFCQISGFTAQELIGQDHRIVNSAYHPKEFIQNLWHTIADGRIWKGEIRNKTKHGSYYWVDTTIVPFLNNEGKPYQYLAIRADITTRKKAENDLQLLNEQLEQRIDERTHELEKATREMEAFSYSVSHDLRAPLRSINGFAQILDEDFGNTLNEEGRRLLSKIITNAGDMGKLIDDLLTFTRLGKIGITVTEFNMHKLVTECITAVDQQALSSRCSIEVADIPGCRGDINMLRQVWLNLIGNAIKYSSKTVAPLVKITGNKTSAEIIYAVQDNGVGFDMQYYNKLFGVFQRLHGAREFEGTGVGLALVKLVVEKHNGRVWATSTPGNGATFYFSLPNL